MTKISLTIEGSADVIAAVLAALPSDSDATIIPAAEQPAAIAPSLPLPVAQAEATAGMTLLPMPTAQPAIEPDDESGAPDPSAPEVDSAGMAWDGRIHSANKKTNSDGTWRKRRGVDAATVTTVEAELSRPIPAPMPMPSGMPMQPSLAPMAQPAPLQPPVQPAPVAAPAPALPLLPTAQQTVVEQITASGPSSEFLGFMQHITAQMSKADPTTGGPLIDADYLAGITEQISNAFMAAGQLQQPLASLTDIAQFPQMIGYAQQLLARDGKWG